MSSSKKKIFYISLIEDPINNGIINSQVISVLKLAVDAGHQAIFFSSPAQKLYAKHSPQEIEDFQKKLLNNGIQFYCKPIPLISNACIRATLLPFFYLY